MMRIIHERDPSFYTKELADYIANEDVEGTKEAKDLIDEINGIIFEDVIEKLKEKYGTDRYAWWMQGVPKGIRIACDERFNNSDGQLERHQFLTLSNYPEIVQFGENWEEFKDYYSFPEKGRKKADQVAWIQRLTIARNITHHVEKGPLSKGQVDYVRRVHRLVKTHIEGGEKVVAGKLYLSDLSEKGPAIEAAD